MEQHFRNFEYDQVIAIADQVLLNKDRLAREQLVTIHKLRALSNYSLLQMDVALQDFIEILKIDPDFNLDPVTTSPKIVTFFNEIKTGLQSYESSRQTIEIKRDTVRITSDNTMLLRNMVARSLVIPGWGHLYLRKTEKGVVLFSLGVASMLGSAYYVYDCYYSQKAYLNANNPDQIAKKYAAFNSAYKNRNLFLTAYALLWVYSQTDVLFSQSKKLNYKIIFSVTPSGESSTPSICCSFHF
ncbi:MAG TPA: hypothetical protein PLP19_20270 [bacterium]|nr:hypothetical protein [bacterium]HPN45832.1 hypothetical protein [bacterium]